MVDGDTRVDEPFENQATDQEDSIVDETLNLSTVQSRIVLGASPRSTLSRQQQFPPILRTRYLDQHAVRGLNVEQAYH